MPILHFDIPIHIYQKCGTSARAEYVNITCAAQEQGENLCRSLPALHAFTGCDMVSAFAKKGKVAPLNIVKAEEQFYKPFQKLGMDWTLSDETFNEIQAFMCRLYGCKIGIEDVNLYRYQMFLARKGEVESYMFPPCTDMLWKHVLRAVY